MNEPEPMLRIIRGDATSEELAAVVGALLTLTPRSRPERPHRLWGAPATALRRPLHPGPGAWRASGLPR